MLFFFHLLLSNVLSILAALPFSVVGNNGVVGSIFREAVPYASCYAYGAWRRMVIQEVRIHATDRLSSPLPLCLVSLSLSWRDP